MPVIFRQDGIRFFFYSDEGDPREPVHVHVSKADAEAKFWLYPDIAIAYTTGFDARTLATLRRIVEARRGEIEEAWHDHFR